MTSLLIIGATTYRSSDRVMF